VAGEPEAAARAARLAAGVPVADGIWEEIRAAAGSVGVDA
jgi:LDH2 family malate/lactate/ureidoglycolate dehydrogenase